MKWVKLLDIIWVIVFSMTLVVSLQKENTVFTVINIIVLIVNAGLLMFNDYESKTKKHSKEAH